MTAPEFLLEHMKLPVSYLSPRRVKMMEAAGHGQIENGYVRFAAHAWQFLIFVAGGLGGFGLEVARWLASRGAGPLVLGEDMMVFVIGKDGVTRQ